MSPLSCPSPRAHISRGFTLVELLVVIGIIAVLIGILLPSLQAARRNAMGVKCASQLRQIATGIEMYIADNKGVLPPAQLQVYSGTTLKYNIDGLDYPVLTGSLTTNAMWTAFIDKYVHKGKGGMSHMASSDPTAAAKEMREKSVYWCPSWDGHLRQGIAGQGDTVMWQTGYGYNPYLLKQPQDTTSSGGGQDNTNFILNFYSTTPGRYSSSNTTAPGGRFLKKTQVKNQTERALLADGQFWLLEALSPPVNSRTVSQKGPGNGLTYSNAPKNANQTTFDWYRHGKYPKLENAAGSGGWFAAEGGKVNYNILYVDGHVANSTGKDDSWKSVWMRGPTGN